MYVHVYFYIYIYIYIYLCVCVCVCLYVCTTLHYKWLNKTLFSKVHSKLIPVCMFITWEKLKLHKHFSYVCILHTKLKN